MTTSNPVSTLPATTPYMRRLESGLIVPATDGTQTFVTQRSMFPGYFHSDFESYGTNVPSDPTPEMLSDLYEPTRRHGNFITRLASLGLDLDMLFWRSQHQGLVWIEKYPQHLHADGRATFIPFIVGGKRHIARVRNINNNPSVHCFLFGNGNLWDAERYSRWVLPQPQPAP